MQSVTINGLSVHAELSVGANPGSPPIVFSNSLGTDFRIWDDVVAALAGRHTVLRYDSRGHGLTDLGETPYAMETLSADLAGLIEHFELTGAVVVGLSVGGMIAQGLALSRPELINGLVLSNTAHKIGDEAGWRERIATIESGGLAASADATLRNWFTPDYRSPDNPQFQLYRNMLLNSPIEGYVATCHALSKADFSHTAPKIGCPTLCIAGDRDGSTPPDLVRSLADRIEGADFRLIENAGHIPCVEKPDAYATALETFIADRVTKA